MLLDAIKPSKDVDSFTDTNFHGADWREDLEQQWREAIDASVARMLDGYKERVTI